MTKDQAINILAVLSMQVNDTPRIAMEMAIEALKEPKPEELLIHENGDKSLNELYYMIGLDPVELGNLVGWNNKDH